MLLTVVWGGKKTLSVCQINGHHLLWPSNRSSRLQCPKESWYSSSNLHHVTKSDSKGLRRCILSSRSRTADVLGRVHVESEAIRRSLISLKAWLGTGPLQVKNNTPFLYKPLTKAHFPGNRALSSSPPRDKKWKKGESNGNRSQANAPLQLQSAQVVSCISHQRPKGLSGIISEQPSDFCSNLLNHD